jgi:hypothetical protein
MARKLKTYQTSLGFYDLAIATPSMKAALEAWGADSNLFHQGAARESEDRQVIAATMAKPGLILRRPVGSNGPFGESAELPTDLGNGGGRPKRAGRKPQIQKTKKVSSRPVDKTVERNAAIAYEREQKQRQRERAREEAEALKERERRQRKIDEAQQALDAAKREHAKNSEAIQADREAVEKRSHSEELRWAAEKNRLETVLQRVRN